MSAETLAREIWLGGIWLGNEGKVAMRRRRRRSELRRRSRGRLMILLGLPLAENLTLWSDCQKVLRRHD